MFRSGIARFLAMSLGLTLYGVAALDLWIQQDLGTSLYDAIECGHSGLGKRS